MVPKEYKITLIVKRHNAAPNKFGALGEQGVNHPPYLLAKSSVEVVEYHLRYVALRCIVVCHAGATCEKTIQCAVQSCRWGCDGSDLRLLGSGVYTV